MAKRFSDNVKWSDEWFGELSPQHKLAYLYILDNCDQVGVWKPNFRLANFQLGFEINWDDFKNICGPGRIFLMSNGCWWVVKFCFFQYGTLSEESKSQTTAFYIKMLKHHNLWIAYTEGIYTPKDKDKEKEKEKEKTKEKEDDEEFSFRDIDKYKESFDNDYKLDQKVVAENQFEPMHLAQARFEFWNSKELDTEMVGKSYQDVQKHFLNWCRLNKIRIKQKPKSINNGNDLKDNTPIWRRS